MCISKKELIIVTFYKVGRHESSWLTCAAAVLVLHSQICIQLVSFFSATSILSLDIQGAYPGNSLINVNFLYSFGFNSKPSHPLSFREPSVIDYNVAI